MAVNYYLENITSGITVQHGSNISNDGSFTFIEKKILPMPGYTLNWTNFSIQGFPPQGSGNCVKKWTNDQGDNPGIALHDAINAVSIQTYGCSDFDEDVNAQYGNVTTILVVLKPYYEVTPGMPEQIMMSIDMDGDATPINQDEPEEGQQDSATLPGFDFEVTMVNGEDSNCEVVYLPLDTLLHPYMGSPIEGTNNNDWTSTVRFTSTTSNELGQVFATMRNNNAGLPGFFVVPKEGYTLSRHNLSIKTYHNSSPLWNPFYTSSTNLANEPTQMFGGDPEYGFNTWDEEDPQTGLIYSGFLPASGVSDLSNGYLYPNRFDNIVRLRHAYGNANIAGNDSVVFAPYGSGVPINSFNELVAAYSETFNNLDFITNSSYALNIKYGNGYEDPIDLFDCNMEHQYFAATTYASASALQGFNDNFVGNSGFSIQNYTGTSTNGTFGWQGVNMDSGPNLQETDDGSSVFELVPWCVSLIDIATGFPTNSFPQIQEQSNFSETTWNYLLSYFNGYNSFYGYDWIDNGFPYSETTGVIPGDSCSIDFQGNFVAIMFSTLGNYIPAQFGHQNIKVEIHGSAMPLIEEDECVDYDVIIETES